jgi:hypothetical protein
MPDIADSERGLPPTRARTNNPGDRVGTESRNGVLYARYRARPNTWVSASMKELGYDRVYGPDSAYGARTGMVLGADGKPLKDPDRIQPGRTGIPHPDRCRRATGPRETPACAGHFGRQAANRSSVPSSSRSRRGTAVVAGHATAEQSARQSHGLSSRDHRR